MLAGECKALIDIRFPGYVSPKLDGIRCLLGPTGGAVSRNLKPIPNMWIRGLLARLPDEGLLDGELIVGDPQDPASWNTTSSGVMSRDGKPDFTYYVFDKVVKVDTPFRTRYLKLKEYVKDNQGKNPWLRLVPHNYVDNLRKLRIIENKHVDAGFEGIMFRSQDGHYKFGRSTAKEQWLLKIKRFCDAEATIIGFKEKMHNDNAATVSALGYTERSSHKANKRGAGTLGAFKVRAALADLNRKDRASDAFNFDLDRNEVEFGVGTGLDDVLRARIWANQKRYLGKVIKFKYQKLSPDNEPIFPVFVGFRKD